MSQYPPPGQYGEQYPSPPPGGYPQQQPGGYPPPPGGGGQQYWQESPKGKGLAITALVLGILSLPAVFTVIGGVLLGLIALILGIVALSKARKGQAGGMGMAVAGLILGALGLVGSVIFGLIIWVFVKDTGVTDYVDCIQQAGSDQAKIDQCDRDFNQRLENKYGVTITPEPTR